MSEHQPPVAETNFEPVVPISELVDDISEADAALITTIASLNQSHIKTHADLSGLMPWALDQAFMHPHATAQELFHPKPGLSTLRTEALRHAQKVERSGIAYRVSGNPKLQWMARVTDDTYAVLRNDRVFRDRRDKYSREPNASWLYKSMQSRLLLCLAWMMEGKEMDVRRIHPTIQQRIAAESMQFLDETDGV
jgi:hypothetical protein